MRRRDAAMKTLKGERKKGCRHESKGGAMPAWRRPREKMYGRVGCNFVRPPWEGRTIPSTDREGRTQKT